MQQIVVKIPDMDPCAVAENHFMFAEPGFIDAAIHDMNAAEQRRGREWIEIRTEYGIPTTYQEPVYVDPVEERIALLKSYFYSGRLSSAGADFVLDEIRELWKTKLAAGQGD